MSGVEAVLAGVLGVERCKDIHAPRWLYSWSKCTPCESCKSWGAHVAAEQAKALAGHVRSEGPLSRARKAVKDHLWGDEFPDDEADCCVDAVLTSIFGGA